MKKISIKERFKRNGITVLACLGVASVYVLLGTGCFSRTLFGLPCPFCGMSRAIGSALQGNFKLAFELHPLFMIFPIYGLLLVNYMNFKEHFKPLMILTVLFFVVFIFRLLTVGIP